MPQCLHREGAEDHHQLLHRQLSRGGPALGHPGAASLRLLRGKVRPRLTLTPLCRVPGLFCLGGRGDATFGQAGPLILKGGSFFQESGNRCKSGQVQLVMSLSCRAEQSGSRQNSLFCTKVLKVTCLNWSFHTRTTTG